MSGTAGTTLACTDCGSNNVQKRGTNVRGGPGQVPYHICGACGNRMRRPDRRPHRREPPDKPSRGLARTLWEMGEEEAAEAPGGE